MAKSILKTCILTTCVLLTSLSVSAQTGQPYYNVMAPPYNATCNGNPASDDTGAIQHALNDANAAGGGAVLIPVTSGACIIQSSLNLDHFSGVSLTGPRAGNTGLSSRANPMLLFTGTASPLLSMKSTLGVSIKNLTLQYNNPSFSGTFIDLSHASTPPMNDSDMDYIADCTVQGTGNAVSGANPLVSLDKTIDVTIERNIFEWATNGIVGPAASGSYSNVVRIRDNLFSGYGTNSIWGNMILNLGTAWIIEGNTFEMDGASPDQPIPINANSVGCLGGCQITGNWIGDVHSQFRGALITGHFQGTSMTGNLISGAVSTAATGILLGSDSAGVSITGNDFSGLASAFNFFGGGQSNIVISGNQYSAVSAFSTSWSGAPASGIVTDNSGQTLVYGPAQFTGQVVFDNSAIFLGTIYKPAGSFRIDHPLDPANKYLSHSFVESPDMMNIYNGVVLLDSRGRAEVKLPNYFEALNQDFRYQLTSIGTFAPVYVAQKIKGNSFRIAGGKPGMEVSWQVTGIRHDAYANAHRIVVEEDKPAKEKGHSRPE